jgi:DNA-binding transcriptional LysR family regulator
MDERQLAAFRLIAEELSFSRAAARLRLTQPALSMMIGKLEGQLGVRLIDRSKRRVSLTEPGKVFLRETELTLQQIELSKSMAQRAALGRIGRITVGFVEAAPFSVLPRLVAHMRRELPEIELVLREMLTTEQMEALDAGRIDIGLMRPIFASDEFESVKIFDEPYVVALPNGHFLANQSTVAYADLIAEHLIANSLPKRRYIESRFKSAVTREGLGLPIAHEVESIHAVIGLVAGGLGIAFLPQSASVIRLPGVCYKPFEEATSPRSEMRLVWRKSETSLVVLEAVQVLREASRAMAAGEPALKLSRAGRARA